MGVIAEGIVAAAADDRIVDLAVDVVESAEDAAAGDGAEAVEVEGVVEGVDVEAAAVGGLGELELDGVGDFGDGGQGGGGVDGVEGGACVEQGVGDVLKHVPEGAVGAGGEGGGVDGWKAGADPDQVFVAWNAGGILDDLLEGGEREVEADAYAFADGFGLLELPGPARGRGRGGRRGAFRGRA